MFSVRYHSVYKRYVANFKASRVNPLALINLWLYRSVTKVKVKVTLEQATKSHSGSRGIALFFL
jgi:hypothetical protein